MPARLVVTADIGRASRNGRGSAFRACDLSSCTAGYIVRACEQAGAAICDFVEENVMKAVLVLIITLTVLALGNATKIQAAPASRVSVIYVPPKDSANQPIYEHLKEYRFHEKLQEFLSPFQLPRTLLIKVEGCDGNPDASYENSMIVICYEYIDQLWKAIPLEPTPAGVTAVDALVGPLFDTCLHEFAHAMFDMLQLPVLGREEDAADQVSAYIMLHLGKVEARRLIAGAAYAYKTEAEAATAPPAVKQFADAHGTPAQRFYNLLCIAYGADAQVFGDMVEEANLPKERADDCKDEYRQVAHAYEKLIGPHIDWDLAKNLFDKNWLPDGTISVPRRSGSTQPK
jgi:Putative metallopeptidase